MDKDNIKKSLSQFAVFKELSDLQIETLSEYCNILSIVSGSFVFSRGGSAEGLYILLTGQIKLTVASPQGMVKVFSIVTTGESFGETGLFLEHQLPFDAEATVNSQVLLVPQCIMHSLLDSNANVARKMQETLSISLHQMIHHIEMLSFKTAVHRFIDYLLQIIANSAIADCVLLPTKKGTIASILNITPETLSRCIKELQTNELIEVNGDRITIKDFFKLRKFKMDII